LSPEDPKHPAHAKLFCLEASSFEFRASSFELRASSFLLVHLLHQLKKQLIVASRTPRFTSAAIELMLMLMRGFTSRVIIGNEHDKDKKAQSPCIR
jgi:hypothetical protein